MSFLLVGTSFSLLSSCSFSTVKSHLNIPVHSYLSPYISYLHAHRENLVVGFCFLNYPAYLQKSLGCLLFKIEVMNLCFVLLNARRWKSDDNSPTCSGIRKAVAEKRWHKTTEMTKWLQVRFSVAWKVRRSGLFCRRCQPYKVIFLFTFEITLLYSIKVCLVLHFYPHVLEKNPSQPQLDCLICVHWLVFEHLETRDLSTICSGKTNS